MKTPKGDLNIFWLWGCAFGKGLDFPDTGITDGIDFDRFGTKNQTNFLGFENRTS